jgi:hypothetical protein
MALALDDIEPGAKVAFLRPALHRHLDEGA